VEGGAGRADSRAPLAPPRSIGIGVKDPCRYWSESELTSLNRRVWPETALASRRVAQSARFRRTFRTLPGCYYQPIFLREIERWFPQRNLSDTPLSVRAWRPLHAIQRIRRYGDAWPKDGCGALNWLKSKTRSGKVAASESWIGSPHSLELTNIRLRRGHLRSKSHQNHTGQEWN
jgi:hypothetical protein